MKFRIGVILRLAEHFDSETTALLDGRARAREAKPMFEGSKRGLWIAAGAVAALVLGYFLPQHLAPRSTVPAPDATVPAQLLANDQNLASATAAPKPTRVTVYVCGAVHRPGVYTLSASSRVTDGIARAGGAAPDADLEQLNLAEPLTDAMKLDVPKKGQVVAATSGDSALSTSGDQGTRRHSSRRGGGRGKLQPGQTLNINTATESELKALPGVGLGLARRIVEYRTANGPFQSVDDLQNVSGIGPSKFERMAPYIRL